MIDDIECNDGIMEMKITQTALKKDNSGIISKGSYTIYRIQGKDSLGEFDVERRYREFLLFRATMFGRYPGLYIPPIPGKVNQGKNSQAIVDERNYYLNRFLNELSKQRYLASSPEMQIFLRPKGPVTLTFKNLQPINTELILKYYKVKIPIYNDLAQVGFQKVREHETYLKNFVKQQRKTIDHLKTFQKLSVNMVPLKDQIVRGYQSFADFIANYEESNEESELKQSNTTPGLTSTRMVSGASQQNLKYKMEQLPKKMSNSFKHIKNWIKEELMNLESLVSAIDEKEACVRRKQKCQKVLSSERALVEKINHNKFDFKLVMKSQDSKQAFQTDLIESIKQREEDIQRWDDIKKFLIVYQATIVTNYFNQNRVNFYLKAMTDFSFDELSNAKNQIDCWQDFNELTNNYR